MKNFVNFFCIGDVLISHDVWSIGIITYLLGFKELPFNGSTNDELYKDILENEIKFNDNNDEKDNGTSQSSFSNEYKDFVAKIQ